jgi:hypothetical protein
MVLLDGVGKVREFLSYEGVLVGLGGAAAGLASVDVGVAESSSTPVGGSLQRVGEGSRGDDFLWQVTSSATAGTLNSGQRLLAPALPGDAGVALSAGAPWPLWLLGLIWLALRRRAATAG